MMKDITFNGYEVGADVDTTGCLWSKIHSNYIDRATYVGSHRSFWPKLLNYLLTEERYTSENNISRFLIKKRS